MNVVLNVHRNHKSFRDGGGGGGEIIYLSLHCHHQNDSCTEMGSDESHVNVSVIVRDKVTRQCPQTIIFLKRKENRSGIIVQELCERRGGRPWLSVLTSLLVSVDVKNYCTVLRHWSQLVPNTSTDI